MSLDSAKDNYLDTSFDEDCWESARSSWIYMEMEPRNRGCWFDNGFNVSYETGDQGLNSSGNSDGASVVMTSCNTSSMLEDVDTSIEFIEDLSFGHIDESVECEEDDGHKTDTDLSYTTYNSLVSNDNFILTKQSTEVDSNYSKLLPNSICPNFKRDVTASTRRSLSLDSYLPQKNQNLIMKQSETVHFANIAPRIQAYPQVPHYPQRLSSKYSPSQFQRLSPLFTSPPTRCTTITKADLDTDRESMISECTMATVSTAGSCNSLYRIPTKLRKLSFSSSSGNSSWSAITRKHNCSVPETLKPGAQSLASTLPRLLQDTFSYLWCDNPDRDPFNTFSVTETDLTAAIVHLEQQLSNSISNKNQFSLLSEFVQRDSPLTLSSLGSSSSTHQSTSTASDVADEDSNTERSKSLPFRVQFIMESYCSIYMTRKQDLRELKMLQKQENKQITDLQYKNQVTLESKEKKFDSDISTKRKTFDQDLDTLNKQHKQLIEKAEQDQQNDMKNAARKLKTEQEKDLKQFRDKQKQQLKQELDRLPRGGKKDATLKMRETKQIEMEDKERNFLVSQMDRTEKHMRQLAEQHRQKIAVLESQCLQQKQQLFRTREVNLWEMERNQLHERHQLMKTQLNDMFFVKRHQMLTRHQKEMENLKRYNQAKEEEMLTRHAMEKKRLPKFLKSEAKTRSQMFKQSLRLSNIGTPDDDKNKIKQFEESEKKRMKSEQMRQEEKHKRQLKAMTDKNEATVKELEQLQAEKRKMLMEQETLKMKELDDQFTSEMNKWKVNLVPRKQALEDQFQREIEEQQSFYADVAPREGGIPAMPSIHSSMLQRKGKDSTMNPRHSTVI